MLPTLLLFILSEVAISIMKVSNNELILIGAGVVGIVIILNALNKTVDTVSQDTGNLITTAAPWGLGGLAIWGLLFL